MKGFVQTALFDGIVQGAAQSQQHNGLADGHIHRVQQEPAADVDGELPAHQNGVAKRGHEKSGQGEALEGGSAGLPHAQGREEGGGGADDKVQGQSGGKGN